jgi:uncharacterized protein YndB with AHSA1/START domain
VPIRSIESDPERLTLTAIGDYPVPVERLWKAWTDPRQLERVWGPPQWPATFTDHDGREGGRSAYFMTGPNGETSHGYWRFEAVEPNRRFAVRDGFANPDGTRNAALPESRMEVRFEATDAGARFVAVSTFASVKAMEQMVSMGLVEGMTEALAQLDDVLADLCAFAADIPAALEVIGDNHAVVRRVVRGTIEQVWRAHNEAALLQQWLLGPEGWTMPVCEVATKVGESYRYEWENSSDGQRFGFVDTLLELEPPRRTVTTQLMIGVEGTPTTMDNLTAGTAGSWEKSPKEARPRDSYPAPHRSSGVRHQPKRVSDLPRNRCPTSAETGVRLGPKHAEAGCVLPEGELNVARTAPARSTASEESASPAGAGRATHAALRRLRPRPGLNAAVGRGPVCLFGPDVVPAPRVPGRGPGAAGAAPASPIRRAVPTS